MRRIRLGGDDLIITDEIRDLNKFNEYIDTINQGHCSEMRPLVVCSYIWAFDYEGNVREYISERLQEFIEQGASYFILDGCHSGCARIFAGEELECIELTSDEDLEYITDHYKEFGINLWPHTPDVYETIGYPGFNLSIVAYRILDFGESNLVGILNRYVQDLVSSGFLNKIGE